MITKVSSCLSCKLNQHLLVLISVQSYFSRISSLGLAQRVEIKIGTYIPNAGWLLSNRVKQKGKKVNDYQKKCVECKERTPEKPLWFLHDFLFLESFSEKHEEIEEY
jgi:hypothetical protein